MTTIERISPTRFLETAGLEDWRVLGEGAVACFRTGSFATGVRFVQAVAELPGDRRPALDLRDDCVTVRLITASAGYYGLTATEVELARQVSTIARELGSTAGPVALHGVEVAIDALARADVLPFWRAVLGRRRRRPPARRLARPVLVAPGRRRWQRGLRLPGPSPGTSGPALPTSFLPTRRGLTGRRRQRSKVALHENEGCRRGGRGVDVRVRESGRT